MKLKNPFLQFSLFLFFAFLTSGCFEYEETVTVRKDGSGEMAVHYFGPEGSDIDIDGFKLNPKDERKSREDLERKFSGPGLRLKSYESKIRGDEQHVYFTVAFDQFTNLARARWWGDQSLDAGQRDGKNFWQRRIKDGDHDWEKEKSPAKRGEWLKEEIAGELAAHIKLRFVVETGGEIIDTNARDHMPRRAVWRFDGGDLLEPEGLDMRVTWK